MSKFPVAEHPTDYEPLADGQSIVTEGANLKVNLGKEDRRSTDATDTR